MIKAELAIDGAEDRVLALLAIAYGEAVSPSVLGNIRRASCEWSQGADETWLLGLAAYEGGWLGSHNREINNPFGVTHGGGRDVEYDSIEEAVAAWERRYGLYVQGAKNIDDFVHRLFARGYNTETKGWTNGVTGAIHAVQRRLVSWKSRHGF